MSSAKKPRVHLHELEPRAVALTMVGVLIAMFMGALDSTIVATAMPAIARSFGGLGTYSGVITAYLIASTVALPIGGRLSDVYGRKRFLILGMLWFTAASLLCGLAGSMLQLIVFRALKGVGAGVMQAAATATIADLYPPARRGRVIGLLTTMSLVASVAGPLLGGYLTDGPGWRYVFFINLPVGLVGCAVILRYFPRLHRAEIKDFKIDYWGALLLVAGVVPLLLALHYIGDGGDWLQPDILGLLVAGVAFSAIFLAAERKASHPIVPLQLFKDPIISIGLLNTGLSMAVAFGLTLLTPLFLQGVLHDSARVSGEMLLPISATFGISATSSGILAGRIGRYRNLALAGTVIAVIGAVMLTQVSAETSRLTLLCFTVTTALGLGICMPLYNIAVQNAAKLQQLGLASSMVYFTRLMTAALAVAVYGAMLVWGEKSSSLAAALSHIFWLMLGLCAAILVTTIFLKEIPLRRSNKKESAT
ncbi:MAG TPA: MDR family MFS transporter [Gammaproteobacteria bacterium]